MPQLVSFEEPIENLVQFVEETPPAEIVEATFRKLRAGEAPNEMLAAAGLAVSRSTELPNLHHGGPVHPVAGLYAISKLGERLNGEQAMLPAIQSVALANKHIHSPEMGPAALAAIDPGSLIEKNKTELLEAFTEALQARVSPTAERHLVALLKVAEPDDILEAMLSVATPRNALDDHYFLYLVYAFRGLDAVGWRHAEVMLRPPLRFLTRHPKMEPPGGERGAIIADGIAHYREYGDLESLVDDRCLANGDPRFETTAAETATIDALADSILNADRTASVAPLLADAIADGLSVMGCCEALSIGAGRRYLRTKSGNPFDVHYHTGANARRYLLSREGLTLRTRLLALLSWGFGYEVRHLDGTLTWPSHVSAEELGELPARSQQDLLKAISESIIGQPVLDLDRLEGSIADVVAAPSVRDTVVLAEQYVSLGYDVAPFFDLMADLVCRDDMSEMHAYKMQQAAYEEFHATRAPYRGVHLVSAAKHAATVTQMRPQTVYSQATALLGD